MKKFCKSSKEHAKNIISFEKKEMLPLTKELLKSHQDPKVCYIWGKRIWKKLSKSKNYQKVRDHCHYTGKYRGASHSICNSKFHVPNKIPVFFHNGSKYDYHFIKKIISKRVWGKIWMPWGKYRKVQKIFCFNRKRSCKN